MASNRLLAANLFSGVAVNVFRIVIQAIMLWLMARLVGPEEMGLYQLAMPMLTFVLLLADAGMGDSLAREKSDGTQVWSSAFWGLLIGGTLLSLGVYGASFFYAYASHQPRLPHIMLPLCLTLFLVCVTVIPQARLMREGNLLLGNVGDFLATLTGAVVGIWLAFSGYGVWALVGQFVSTSVVRAVFLNWVRPVMPRFEFDFKALLAHTHVGGAILGGRLIDTGGRFVEFGQVSRVLGEAGLGAYGYANQIGRFFSDSVGNSMWANLYYVAINKSPEEAIRYYARSHRVFALIMFPAVALLTVALPTLIPPVLGAKWIGSTYPIIAILLTTPFGTLGGLSLAVLLARRKIWITLGAGLFFAIARIIVTFVAVPYGVTGLCIVVGAINFAYYLYVIGFISPIIGSKASELVRVIVGPLLAAAAAGVCYHFLLGSAADLIWLVFAGGLSFLVYPVALFLIDNRRTRDDFTAARDMLLKKSQPA
jgi:PST family polysaccharide transporter